MWLSTDPLAEKYSNFNPYNYCFNSPVNYIDPDGKDGIRIVDDKNKTITIKAVFYVQTVGRFGKNGTVSGYSTNEIKRMNEYNKKLNDQNAVVSEGNYAGYSVKYDLQFKEGGSINEIEAKGKNEYEDGFHIGNSLSRLDNTYAPFEIIEIDNGDGTVTKLPYVGGATPDKKNIIMNSYHDTIMNRIHEIFHTLGFSHQLGGAKEGVMKYPPEMPNQNDINRIANDNFLPEKCLQNE